MAGSGCHGYCHHGAVAMAPSAHTDTEMQKHTYSFEERRKNSEYWRARKLSDGYLGRLITTLFCRFADSAVCLCQVHYFSLLHLALRASRRKWD